MACGRVCLFSLLVCWGAIAGARAQGCLPSGVVQDDCGGPAAAAVAAVDTVHPLLEAAALFLVPKVLQDGFLLKEYVRSTEFRRVRDCCGDPVAVDALFRRALRVCWNNPYVTLTIVLAAVLDHDRFGVRLPLLGPLLWFPLTSEFPGEFEERRTALPSQLFADSPAWGDRDKLQHFFGSALAAVCTESADAAERIGSFVEWGEGLFVVGGTVESRDTECNRRGISFGLAFLRDRAALPSAYLRAPLQSVVSDSVRSHEEIRP